MDLRLLLIIFLPAIPLAETGSQAQGRTQGTLLHPVVTPVAVAPAWRSALSRGQAQCGALVALLGQGTISTLA